MPRLMPPVIDEDRLHAIEFPTLLSDGLVLRPFSAHDTGAVLAAYADPDIQRWHVRAMTNLAEAEQWIAEGHLLWEQRRRLEWAVQSNNAVIGRVCLRGVDPIDGTGEVGYWVLPAARGHGVAGRAIEAMARWCFDELGLHRLQLEHSMTNSASCRAAEKTSFAAEGIRRAGVLHLDGWHDMHQHGRVAA